MRSRYGSYSNGKLDSFNLFGFTQAENYPFVNPTNIEPNLHEYTRTKGVHDLTSTYYFPKAESRIVSSGLTSPLFYKGFNLETGLDDVWTQYTIDISRYRNQTARVVFRLDTQGTGGFTPQLDLVNVSGTSYDFEATGHSWQTSSGYFSEYSSVTWVTLAVATTANRWNVDTAGIPSGLGATTAASGSYYVYCDNSGVSLNGGISWLRTPALALGASPTLSFYYISLYAGQPFTVHLDIQ